MESITIEVGRSTSPGFGTSVRTKKRKRERRKKKRDLPRRETVGP